MSNHAEDEQPVPLIDPPDGWTPCEDRDEAELEREAAPDADAD